MGRTGIVLTAGLVLLRCTLAIALDLDPDHASVSVSLAAADSFQSRLAQECHSVGVVAFYQGALGQHWILGIEPSSTSGQWDVYPLAKVLSDASDPPKRMTESDRLFFLRATRKSEENSVGISLDGEKVFVSIHGVPKEWRFPQSQETVESLLKKCSDVEWHAANPTRADDLLQRAHGSHR